ncbi:hypothetical protein, partial [Escherichia coli]|uniref:hypothetical protein n=1 Tax=Escherichia coli TaxID=562 RepID=UPI003EE0632D
ETRYDVLLSEMLYILIRGDSLMPSGITLDNAYPAMIRYIYGTEKLWTLKYRLLIPRLSVWYSLYYRRHR